MEFECGYSVMIWPNLRWWIVDAGTHRQQWAHLEPGGKVAIYDARGKLIY
ncbi:MAG: hypothetical protein U5K56_18425 [Halioglobus sp.]|nr:hypothetical protein [Halioglobus sp.]